MPRIFVDGMWISIESQSIENDDEDTFLHIPTTSTVIRNGPLHPVQRPRFKHRRPPLRTRFVDIFSEFDEFFSLNNFFTSRRSQFSDDEEEFTRNRGPIIEELLDEETPYVQDLSDIPFVSLKESTTHFIIEVELPGHRKEDLKLDVVGLDAVISGTITEEMASQEMVDANVRNKRGQKFQKKIEIPKAFDPKKISAEFKDGILRCKVERKGASYVEVNFGK